MAELNFYPVDAAYRVERTAAAAETAEETPEGEVKPDEAKEETKAPADAQAMAGKEEKPKTPATDEAKE